MGLGNPFYLRRWVGFHWGVWKNVSMVGEPEQLKRDVKVQAISAFMTIYQMKRDVYLCEYRSADTNIRSVQLDQKVSQAKPE